MSATTATGGLVRPMVTTRAPSASTAMAMSTRRTPAATGQTANPSVASKHQEPDDDLLTDLFTAYYCARANKRNTWAQVKFEQHLTDNLMALYEDIRTRRYKVGRSICFIIRDPVQREIFAASFRDRIVHHLVYNDLSPVFERDFINDSYSCRTGRGTLYGLDRLMTAMSECSAGFTRDTWVLKLDISGYFMNINRQKLYDIISSHPALALCTPVSGRFPSFPALIPSSEINSACSSISLERRKILHYLLSQIIFNDPTKGCRIKGSSSDWHGLPQSKSLFWSPPGCGLPIGNLTSQLFSNIYLDRLDHFITEKLGFRFYGRYVDDFYLVDADKEHLLNAIGKIRTFLREELCLTLHPRKVYLQPVCRGVKFLGAVLYPECRYPSSRTLSRYRYSLVESLPSEKDLYRRKAVLDSYKGYFSHFSSSV